MGRRRLLNAGLLVIAAAATLAFLVSLCSSDVIFDELVEDYPKPGEESETVMYALEIAADEASRDFQDEGVMLAVRRRGPEDGKYSLGLLNKSDRSVFISTSNGDVSLGAEVLNSLSATWEDCNVGRCGTGMVHGVKELEAEELLKFESVAATTSLSGRSWIRFRIQLRRSDGRFQGPFTVVSSPVHAKDD